MALVRAEGGANCGFLRQRCLNNKGTIEYFKYLFFPSYLGDKSPPNNSWVVQKG